MLDNNLPQVGVTVVTRLDCHVIALLQNFFLHHTPGTIHSGPE